MEPPYGALDPWQDYKPPEVEPLPRDLDTILLCGHDLLLPDLPTMHTRMLLLAWELGLEGVTEEAAQLLILALQVSLYLTTQASVCQKKMSFVHAHLYLGRGLGSTCRAGLRNPGLNMSWHESIWVECGLEF